MLDGRYYKPNNIGIVTPQLITVIVYGSRVPSLGETDVMYNRKSYRLLYLG